MNSIIPLSKTDKCTCHPVEQEQVREPSRVALVQRNAQTALEGGHNKEKQIAYRDIGTTWYNTRPDLLTDMVRR